MKYKWSLVALCVASLTACSLDGEDGKDGVNGQTGAQGPAGSDGSNGENAKTQLKGELIGRAVLNVGSPEGAAEIVAFQSSKQRVYAINSSGASAVINLISLANIDSSGLLTNAEGVVTNTNLSIQSTINLNDNTPGDANSIAISNDQKWLAVAMAASSKAQKGLLAIYDISGETPAFVKNIGVGYLPDMVAFSPDSQTILVANEGEPMNDYSVDGEGTISVIRFTEGSFANVAIEVGFSAYNNKQAELEAMGVVFANPAGRTINGKLITTSVAQDLEPEYISFNQNGSKAFISLQENNAIAELNLADLSISIKGLGFKDWGNYDMDASDKDGGMNFKRYPGLYGMYQPDTIATFSWQGADFVVTANEGDGREYFFATSDEASCLAAGGLDFDADDGCLAYSDEIRAKDLNLAANFSYLNNDNDDIGRLKVSKEYGDADNDGLYEKLYTYGGRSFSIWDQNGLQVFDSGDQVAKITAAIHGSAFNNDEDTNEGDTRSDAKGAEPEALAIGVIGERRYAFVGLERMGGIMVFDITNPYNVTFTTYMINRGLVEGADISGDLAPEGMYFIDQASSPTGVPLLIVGNELSGSVSVWQLTQF